MWSKSKPDVEFQYGRRLGEFNGMSSQSHVPRSRVLPSGEFNVMIPELRVTLQSAATGRIQWHVIPEPHITLLGAATWWIHSHDSRATYHIAGCSHLAKSMSWSCHIAGCKNSIRHIENGFLPHFIFFVFNAVQALTKGGFRIVSAVARCMSVRLSVRHTRCDTPVLCLNDYTYPLCFYTIG